MTVPLWLHAAAWWCVIASTFAMWWIEGVSGVSPFVRGWVRGTLVGYLTVALALLFVGACPPAHSSERRTSTVKEVSHEGLHEGMASREGWNEGARAVRQEAAGWKAVEGQSEERGWVGRASSVSGVQGGPRSEADAAVLAGGVTLHWTAPLYQEGYSPRGQRCLAGNVPERTALSLVVWQPQNLWGMPTYLYLPRCVAKLPSTRGQAMAWDDSSRYHGGWFAVIAADSAGNHGCAGNEVWVP